MSLLGFAMLQILPLTIVFGILYFAFIRPQQRQAGAHRKMLEVLLPGDSHLGGRDRRQI